MITDELWICADSASEMDVKWKINNCFNQFPKSGDGITSREFNFGTYSCKISALLRGTEQNADLINFCVMCFCRNRPKMKFDFRITLMTDNDTLYENASRREIHETRDAVIYICDFPRQEIIDGGNNTASTVLTVSCKLMIGSIPEESDEGSDEESETVAPTQSTPCNGSIQDFTDLSINGNDSDVTIKVMGETFGVHKSIFDARAPVFATVLQQKLVATGTDTVAIDDLCVDFCGVSAFLAFLHFVYKGEVKNISTEIALELYVFADKYELKELKQLCLECRKKKEYNKSHVLAA